MIKENLWAQKHFGRVGNPQALNQLDPPKHLNDPAGAIMEKMGQLLEEDPDLLNKISSASLQIIESAAIEVILQRYLGERLSNLQDGQGENTSG